LRPSNSASATKSMLQISLMAWAIFLGCLSLTALLRRDRLRRSDSQAQIGHDLLELAVLFLELAQTMRLGRPHARVLLASHVEGCIADAHLATHLLNACAQLGLLQRKGDLILRELALLHDMLPAQIGPSSCRSFCYRTVRKPGAGHWDRLPVTARMSREERR